MGKVSLSLETIFVVWMLGVTPPKTLGFASLPQTIQPFAGTCGTDDEIQARDRTAIDDVARSFVRDAIGSSPEVAYALYTSDAKPNASSEQFVTAFKGIQKMGPFKNLHIAHAHTVR